MTAAPRHHPDEPTLLACAAGGLDVAADLVVRTHLSACPACRATVRMAEEVGGALLDRLAPEPMRHDALERLLGRLDRPEAPQPPGNPGLPPPLRHLPPARERWVAPGIRYTLLLRRDGGQLGLLRVRPGASVPQHGHHGNELTCVLEGAFEDGPERYAAGDFTAAGERHSHSQQADATQGCLCLIATHGRLRFGTLLSRLWQPLMPF